MPMFSPTSQGLPATMGEVAEPETADGGLSGLAKRVSAYLARVVGALADFEDRLIREDGFFAREEHFEAQIDSLRREFEHNRRAQILFARADAVGLLIAQLVACLTPSAVAASDLHSRRQQQFVFAASVLLTASTSVRTLREHPALVERLWALVSRPGVLDPVQLQYWCRVAGVLLLRDCGGAVGHSQDFSTGLAPRLPKLLKHIYSDSVCTLIKCLLGLPISSSGTGGGSGTGAGSGSPGATSVPTSQPLPLQVAISGEHSILPACVHMLLSENEGATNAAELLCTLCGSLAERPDALELCGAFVQSFTPLLTRVFSTALTKGATGRVHALRVAVASLRMEWQCSALMEEAHAWLPTELLGPTPSASTAARDHSEAPFARLLAPRLDALKVRLQCDRSLEQVKCAELFATLIETAPKWMHEDICASGLLEAAVLIFLAPDHNGGGRQDFVRHVILRGLRAALGKDGALSMHQAVIVNTELTKRLLRGITSNHKLRSGKEYVKLLYVELASASERDHSIYAMLCSNPKSCWDELGAAVAGTRVPSGQSAPDSPLLSSPPISPSPPSPSPAELIFIEEDLDAPESGRDGVLVASQREEAAVSRACTAHNGVVVDVRRDEGAVASEPPDSVDAENIDPNSPVDPSSPPTHNKKLRTPTGSPAVRTIGTPRPEFSNAPPPVALPQSPPPVSSLPYAAPSTPPSMGHAAAGAAHNGTPRPSAGTPRPSAGTPRPDKNIIKDEHPSLGLASPDDGAASTMSPSASSLLGFVENFGGGGGGDTPQPRLVRRAYLHRKAKERFGSLTPKSPTKSSPSPGKSPSSPGRGGLFSGGSLASFISRTSSPSSSPKRERESSYGIVARSASLLKSSEGEEPCKEDDEDPAISQLRSSVRSLCF